MPTSPRPPSWTPGYVRPLSTSSPVRSSTVEDQAHPSHVPPRVDTTAWSHPQKLGNSQNPKVSMKLSTQIYLFTTAYPHARSPSCWTAWTGNIYWNPWRLDSYVGKDVTIEPCVRDYMIRDKAGIRMVVRDTFDAEFKSASTQTPGLGYEDFWVSREAPLCTLLFRALCLPAETYTISSPPPT